MRPLLALATSVAVMGGVYLYQMFVAGIPFADTRLPPRQADGIFAVEVTLTFQPAPDPFALDETLAEVRFQGSNLLDKSIAISSGKPITTSPVKGIVEATGDREGRNEIFVSVSGQQAAKSDGFSLGGDKPAAEPLARAIRVRVLRDEKVIAEETFWSEQGGRINGKLEFVVEPLDKPETHDH